MSSRRERRARARDQGEPAKSVTYEPQNAFERFYHDKYKLLFLITIFLLIASVSIIAFTYVKTGDVLYKGVSLSGGLTMTVATEDTPLSVDQIEASLHAAAPEADFVVREISELGTQQAITIEASTRTNSQDSLESLQDVIMGVLGEYVSDADGRTSTEIIGPSLGQSFFAQITKAVLIAFVFMGMVVFLYFGETNTQKTSVTLLSLLEGFFIWYSSSVIMLLLSLAIGAILVWYFVRFSIPSAAVILAAISTLLFTIAVVDLFQVRISTAGIAAFLMLIGYSVDTDILLSTRVLKRHEGTVFERILDTVKTGLTMEGTTIAATVVGMIFTQSAVIGEIMLIIFIGLIADIFFTWIQNVGILRLYLEKRGVR